MNHREYIQKEFQHLLYDNPEIGFKSYKAADF